MTAEKAEGCASCQNGKNNFELWSRPKWSAEKVELAMPTDCWLSPANWGLRGGFGAGFFFSPFPVGEVHLHLQPLHANEWPKNPIALIVLFVSSGKNLHQPCGANQRKVRHPHTQGRTQRKDRLSDSDCDSVGKYEVYATCAAAQKTTYLTHYMQVQIFNFNSR